MTPSTERKEDNSTRPDVNCGCLGVVVEEGFWRHVSLGSCSVSDLELLLQLADLFDGLVVFIFGWLSLGIEFQF